MATNMAGQGSNPAPLGAPTPSPMQQMAGPASFQGPDPSIQAAKVQEEIAAIQQLVDRVATQYPSAAGAAKTVVSALESMLQDVIVTMAPPPGSIPEPPPLP